MQHTTVTRGAAFIALLLVAGCGDSGTDAVDPVP